MLFASDPKHVSEKDFHNQVIDSLSGTSAAESADSISYHSAFIHLMEYDSKESVPLLIECLSPIQDKFDGNKKVRLICTWSHLLDALRAQTGEDFGFDQTKWRDWWKTTGKQLHQSHFNTEANKKRIAESYRTNLPSETAKLIASLRTQFAELNIDQRYHDSLWQITETFDFAVLDDRIDKTMVKLLSREEDTVWTQQERIHKILSKLWFKKKRIKWLVIDSDLGRIDALFDMPDESLILMKMSVLEDSKPSN